MQSDRPFVHKLPAASTFFTGREEILQRLKSLFIDGGPGKNRKNVLLYGMGGIGKTQICLKFLEIASKL